MCHLLAGCVCEYESHGETLIGFEGVTDCDTLGEVVTARGHSRGDVLYPPALEAESRAVVSSDCPR